MTTQKVDLLLQRTAELEKELAAKCRELKLEASLETVRSRSLAMHKSSELKEVITIVLQKLQQLGVAMEGRSAVIVVFEEGKKDFHQYVASPEHSAAIEQYTPYVDSPILNDLWRARVNGDDFYSRSYSAKEKNELFNFYFENTELRHLPAKEKIWLLEREHYEVSVALGKHSGIIIANLTASPLAAENFLIFQRFAKVFEQAYIRFLDLQKAESQAREARIEAALERVRARAMAMQRSDELKDLIATVSAELSKLDLVLDRCFIMTFDAETKDTIWWMSHPESPLEPIALSVPYHQQPPYQALLEAWQERQVKWQYTLEGDIKTSWDSFLFTETGLSHLPDYIIANMRSNKHVFFSASFNNFGCLLLATLQPLSKEQFDILLRFAKVFDQTYTRFNDLQKAEAHAREAQIEAAMERLRARAMAMQASDELAVVIRTMYTELKRLDESLNRCFIMIFDEQTGGATWWMAGDDEASTEQSYHIPYSKHLPQLAYLEGWKERREKWLYTMEGNEKKAWDAFLFNETELSILPGIVIQNMKAFEKIYLSASFNGFGCLTTGSVQPLGRESFDILIRFSKVFDLSYTRFSDLKQAEAQALRAEQDLVEIKAARKKAEDTLAALKATQAQLIQAEKMASLGELTAGIAHEIQNPLNFVNNFAEANKELIEELQQEAQSGNVQEVMAISADIKANEEKISHHGKRADSIVKNMLQHSRGSTGEKEPTDINALIDEYLRLSFHGFRGKDTTFFTTIETHFDDNVREVLVAPQDIGRVLLNLFNNAFYAVTEKKKQLNGTFEPVVSVSTERKEEQIVITVKDNGMGMSSNVAEKVFQPFFTTKPTGEGTGLGLSLSYDIVTNGHGGNLTVTSREGEGSEFIILLPV